MEAADQMRRVVRATSGNALLLVQKARREVEVSAGMLMRDPSPQVRTEDNTRTWEKFRTDVWGRLRCSDERAGYGVGKIEKK